MERIFVKEIKKIKSLRAKIEKNFNVKLNITSTYIEVSGEDEDGFSEYLAEKAIEAINMGFSINSAFQLKDDDYMFEKIDIKSKVKPSRVYTVKSRIIGRDGKAKSTLEELTACEIEIKGHYIGIIGKAVDVDLAVSALIKLVQGSPHNKVYAFLEMNQKLRKERIDEEGSLNEEVE